MIMLHIGVQYSHAVADDDVTIGLGIGIVLFGSKIENRFRIALNVCVRLCVCVRHCWRFSSGFY